MAALVLGAALWSGVSSPAARTGSPDPAAAVYPEAAPATLHDTPPPRRVVLLPGRARGDDPRAAEFEALLRLHLALGLRDIHQGPVVLSWAPVSQGPLDPLLCEGPGPLDPDFAPWLRSGERPDPLDRRARPEDDLRLAVDVLVDSDGVQVQIRGCSARRGRFSQVVEGDASHLDRDLAELLIWLGARLGVPDTRPFEDAWRRLPAFGGPSGRAYGQALVGSLGGRVGPDLTTAATLGAEAAWLAAWLGPAEERLPALERATELRWSFTAAVEDVAWAQVEAGRSDLAAAILERLAPADERARPVELALCAALLDRGEITAARDLLDQLPPRWTRTTAAARAQVRIALATGDLDRAAGWIDAWLEADPEAAEAWLFQGDVLSMQGSFRPAERAWQRAVDLDERRAPEAMTRLAALDLRRGEPREFAEILDRRPPALGPPPRWLAELDAWMALRSGDVDRAERGYAALDGPDAPPRLRFDACVAALQAGRGSQSSACLNPAGSPWQRSRLLLALKSREPGLLPGYPPLIDDDVRAQLEAAPRHPAALDAAWIVLGPHLEPPERQRLAARWRVAHGAGATLPTLPWVKD